MSLRSLPAGLALLAFSAAAQAFQAVDTLTPSSSGRFPAYPLDAFPLSLFWIQAGAMVDDNALRTTVKPPTETVLRLGVGGRKDTYVYGRQLLRLEGRIDGYNYHEFDELNNVGYGGLAEWHWELGNDLSGVLGASRRKYQRDLAQLQRPVQDMITQTNYVANAAYRLGPSFRLRGGAELFQYETAFTAPGNVQTATGILGLDYVTALGNTFGIEYRQSHGDAPVPLEAAALFPDNTFREQTLAFTAGYVNPFFRLGGMIGRTHRDYSADAAQDFDGNTWRATADWLVTTKTALGFETYSLPQSLIDLGASRVVVRGVAFGPGWAPTAKLNFSARIMREKQDFSGDPLVTTGVTPLDLEIVRNLRLGAYWEYNRQIHWQFAIDHGERESNVLGRDFKYNAIIGNVRYLFW
jgi:hypothetical protein